MQAVAAAKFGPQEYGTGVIAASFFRDSQERFIVTPWDKVDRKLYDSYDDAGLNDGGAKGNAVETARFRELFDELDRNGDGSVSVRELLLAVRKDPTLSAHIDVAGSGQTTMQEGVQQFMLSADVNQDGTLSWDEFRHYLTANGPVESEEGAAKMDADPLRLTLRAAMRASSGKVLRILFKMVDVNDNGSFSRSEITSSPLCAFLGENAVDIDEDNDGKITLREWNRFFVRKMAELGKSAFDTYVYNVAESSDVSIEDLGGSGILPKIFLRMAGDMDGFVPLDQFSPRAVECMQRELELTSSDAQHLISAEIFTSCFECALEARGPDSVLDALFELARSLDMDCADFE